MKLKIILLLTALTALPSALHAKLRVIATTPDLGAVAQVIGGAEVEVESLAKGFQNPHFVEAKPSLIVKLMKADAFILTGLELEVGWAPLLVQRSANSKIQLGQPGYIDASEAITPLDIPANVSRAMGDVHPGGNPHYMTDPENGKKVAALLAARFTQLAPAAANTFTANLKQFDAALDAKIKEWDAALAPTRGTVFASYHRDWTYFAQRAGWVSAGEVEPKPGIPPTATHTAELIAAMKARGAKIILTDPWFEMRNVEFIAKETGARAVVMAMFPGAFPEAKDYLSAIDTNVKRVLEALKP